MNENWLKGPIAKLYAPYIQWKTPKEHQGRYMWIYKDIKSERKILGLENMGLGWVHLVDSAGRVRWQANGIPNEEELASMVDLTKKLQAMNTKK